MYLPVVKYWLRIPWIWMKIMIKLLDTWSSIASIILTHVFYADMNKFCPTAQHPANISPIFWTLLSLPIRKYFLTQMKGQNWMLFWKVYLQTWYWTVLGMRDKTLCRSSCHKIEITRVVCLILKAFTMLMMFHTSSKSNTSIASSDDRDDSDNGGAESEYYDIIDRETMIRIEITPTVYIKKRPTVSWRYG